MERKRCSTPRRLSRTTRQQTNSVNTDSPCRTYLTAAEAVVYGRFPSVRAFHQWVYRRQVPKCAGRRGLFLRRDLDEAIQSKN
jgi:hypothetical protein